MTGSPRVASTASASIAGSRSSPITRPVDPTRSARARVCPPAPAVPSTRIDPSFGASQSTTSSSSTGRCTGLGDGSELSAFGSEDTAGSSDWIGEGNAMCCEAIRLRLYPPWKSCQARSIPLVSTGSERLGGTPPIGSHRPPARPGLRPLEVNRQGSNRADDRKPPAFPASQVYGGRKCPDTIIGGWLNRRGRWRASASKPDGTTDGGRR